MRGVYRHRKSAAAGFAAVLFLTGCASNAARTTDAKKAAIGKWGFDLDGMDPSVRPGEDFYRYGAGGS